VTRECKRFSVRKLIRTSLQKLKNTKTGALFLPQTWRYTSHLLTYLLSVVQWNAVQELVGCFMF